MRRILSRHTFLSRHIFPVLILLCVFANACRADPANAADDSAAAARAMQKILTAIAEQKGGDAARLVSEEVLVTFDKLRTEALHASESDLRLMRVGGNEFDGVLALRALVPANELEGDTPTALGHVIDRGFLVRNRWARDVCAHSAVVTGDSATVTLSLAGVVPNWDVKPNLIRRVRRMASKHERRWRPHDG